MILTVRSFGTEDRPTDRPVGPSSQIYEYVIFRGNNIKDIVVCQPPKPQPMLEGGLPNDPAIVQVGLRLTNPVIVDTVTQSGSITIR